MPSFSRQSRGKLSTCHPNLRWLFDEVVKESDCTILEGVRADDRQAELFRTGKSKLDGKTKRSKHQRRIPAEGEAQDSWSYAADVAPYPIDWAVHKPAVEKQWLDFARAVLAKADDLGLEVRWGGDWDRDWDGVSDPKDDQRFNDWPHWELL